MEKHYLFRASAYHKEMDFSIIIDAHDLYEAKWLFGSALVAAGLSQIRVTEIESIPVSNIPNVPLTKGSLLLRAIAKGEPIRQSDGRSHQVGDKYYWEA